MYAQRGGRLPILKNKLNLILALTLVFVLSLSLTKRNFLPSISALDSNLSNGITVDSTLDTGDTSIGDGSCDDGAGNCTLRAAIQEANSNPDASTILFNITGTPSFTNNSQPGYTISPTSALPNITEQLTIDGYSQPGAEPNTAPAPQPLNGTLLVEVDGSGAGGAHGIDFDPGSTNSAVRGLVIGGFANADGIQIGANNIQIQGNYLGTNPAGSAANPNQVGVNGTSSTPNGEDAFIGGLNPEERNIISGNTAGPTAAGSYPGTGWVIQGNYVGVAADGTTAIPNASSAGAGAFSIDYVDNVTVGGSVIGAANVISGNANHAVAPSSADNVVVQGNFIGTDYTGTVAIPNGGAGIGFSDSDNVQIGGPGVLARNIIANSATFGISLDRVNDARVENNYIGTDVTGTQKMGNGLHGIDIIDSSNLTIGGKSSALRNIISNNGVLSVAGSGSNITLETSGNTPPSNNAIIGNYIGVDSSGKLNPNFINANGIVMVATATNNIVGGDEANEGNIIAGNRSGIIISTFTITGFGSFSPSKNAIIGNRIFQNDEASALPNVGTSLGIDLMELVEEDFPPDGYDSSANSGPTPNDPTDSDTGPNNYINYPILNSVTQDGTTATINFNLDAADSPTNQYRVEFFSNDTADPSGYGEGQTYLGYTTVSNGTNQQATLTLPSNLNLASKHISATTTAIDNNTTSGDINLKNWAFTTGISLNFGPADLILPAGGYGVVSKNASQTLSTYGVTTIGTYTGNLSNGGEQLVLKNASGEVVNDITYDDASPWAVSPDGHGSSLELRDPNLDNTLAASWGASVTAGGTPGSVNSLVGYEPPIISEVSHPIGVSANSSVSITAKVEDTTGVSLVYKEMFEADQTVVMHDDGTHGDGASGDGVYGATIPGFSASTLVRYKVVAENPGGTASAPGSEESIGYYGYRVASNVAPGTTPVLEWYISDANYDDLVYDPSGVDETTFPCVIVYGDQVFDNSKVRLKGSYSRTFDKKPFKVNLPKGYKLSIPGVIDTPVSEFHLNSDYPSGNRYVSSLLAWRVFDYAGFSTPEKTKVELHRNGAVEGAYTFIEKYDSAWKQDNPEKSTGALYENGGEKKWPDDGNTAPLHDWQQSLKDLEGEDLRNYILNTADVPNIINFMAVQAVIRHNDWSHYQNALAYQDTADTDRWSLLPWDFDLAFQTLPPFNPSNYPGITNMIDPSDTTSSIPAVDRMIFVAIWNDPVLKQMYTRRVRSLVDQVYVNGNLQQWLEEEYQKAQTAAERDDAIRHTSEEQEMRDYYVELFTNLGIDLDNPAQLQALIDASIPGDFPVQDYFNGDTIVSLPSPAGKIAIFNYGLEKQISLYVNDYVNEGLIPEEQVSSATVKIAEISDPGEDYGFIKLQNESTTAVDISGWTIPLLNVTLPGGSVLAGNSEAYVPVKDTAFRQEYGPNNLVLAQIGTPLPNSGVLQLKRSNQSTSSSYTIGGTNEPAGEPTTEGEGVGTINQGQVKTASGSSGSSVGTSRADEGMQSDDRVPLTNSLDVAKENEEASRHSQSSSAQAGGSTKGKLILLTIGAAGALVVGGKFISSLKRAK